jgi:hypothetical protein
MQSAKESGESIVQVKNERNCQEKVDKKQEIERSKLPGRITGCANQPQNGI